MQAQIEDKESPPVDVTIRGITPSGSVSAPPPLPPTLSLSLYLSLSLCLSGSDLHI